jgi:hypothetical protein
MFLRLLLCACCLMALPSRAVTIKTMVHGDWENPACWSGGLVPTNPDTILVRHYMVLHQDLTINAPTVLFIENTGTICGDYLLETGCGAGFINYGHMYLNRIKTRLGTNYKVIECKTNMVIAGCSSPTAGFQSVPPNGSVNVWPPVFCKTADTNWEGGTSTGLPELEYDDLNIYPNPISEQDLSIITNLYTSYAVTDVAGRLICSGSFKNRVVIATQGLSAGMYFLKLETVGTRRIEKILKTD